MSVGHTFSTVEPGSLFGKSLFREVEMYTVLNVRSFLTVRCRMLTNSYSHVCGSTRKIKRTRAYSMPHQVSVFKRLNPDRVQTSFQPLPLTNGAQGIGYT